MTSPAEKLSSAMVLGIPCVSVLLPCFNAAGYLEDAIRSVLVQTFTDFELIIIDDGSTDATPAIIERFTDPRIRFLRQDNRGLAATLNRAVELSAGRYLARMDADDIAHPERLERQVRFLDTHPEVGLLGTWATILEGRDSTSRRHEPPVQNALLKFDLLFGNPMVHSSVMLRRHTLDQVGYYCENPDRQPQDFELWSRLMRICTVANLPEHLQTYREIPTSISRSRRHSLLPQLKKLMAENLRWAGDLDERDLLADGIADLSYGDCPSNFRGINVRRIVAFFATIATRLADGDPSVDCELQRRCRQRRDAVLFQYFPCRYGDFAGRFLRCFDRQSRRLFETCRVRP